MIYSDSDIENLFDEICDKISNGKSLRKSLEDRKINRKTFFDWIKDTEKSNRYARATELRANLLFEEILDICDNPELGIKTKSNQQGIETIEGDMIEHRRLKIDARKWVLSKMNPKKYGEKVGLEHSGEIKTKTTIIVHDNDTANDLKKLLNDND